MLIRFVVFVYDHAIDFSPNLTGQNHSRKTDAILCERQVLYGDFRLNKILIHSYHIFT